MPLIEGYISELTGQLAVRLEQDITSAVTEALAADMDPPRIVHLAVRQLPGSGKPAELMDKAEISPRHIVAAAKRLYGL